MFSTSETSVHVLDKNREISPLQREEGYGNTNIFVTELVPENGYGSSQSMQ